MADENLTKIHIRTAEDIRFALDLRYTANRFYEFVEGYYRFLPEPELCKHISTLLDDKFTTHWLRETISYLKTICFIKPEELNTTNQINLKNGMLDLKSFELSPHSRKIISTIRIPLVYNVDAQCPNWLKTLSEIFEGDQQKIMTLQEFFGLCFTREVKYEKALFLLGEGANGKSVILYVLQQMLGVGNYSVIPLERFDKGPYVINLFGKLANISIETNAKSTVYDSIFKAIVSGDEIIADAKFEPTLSFRPFCKLIFALNNMPRVDDKTSAFYRRLIIITFPRIFSPEEQNKNLKYELLEEVDGVFLWCLEGLKRLETRGDFEVFDEMHQEIEEYRKENNNVLIFVEEKCQLDPENFVSKDEFYRNYAQWCKDHGNYPLQMIKFGKELRKQFPSVIDERTSGSRRWRGIKFNSWE